jgi:hypothetical protein
VSSPAGKRVAIVQSNYIPWKGYFDLINAVDEFILLDDVQYTRNDWRNRNRIKTANGVAWLTIPVRTTGRRTQRVLDAQIADPRWASAHWKTLRQSYCRAPFFDVYANTLAETYAQCTFERLAEINACFIRVICGLLGIETPISRSDAYDRMEGRTNGLVEICRQAGASEYLSGPRARAYLDESAFTRQGIEVTYADYAAYPEYPQVHGPFEHAVTVLDLLFSTGPAAPGYMKSLGPYAAKSRTALTT